MELSRRRMVGLCLGGALGGCRDRGPSPVMVFAAASLEDALREIAAASPAPVSFNFASSGVLARQLLAAPRADLFFSASPDHLAELERAGRIVAGSRRDLLENRLVAVVQRKSPITITRAEELAGASYGHLALGDPASVPAGKYAQQFLASIRVGERSLWQAVEPRVVPMPDVRAALALAERKRDVIAFVYRTDARRSERVRVLFEVEQARAPRIVYPLVRIVGGPNPDGGRALAEQLASPEAAKIFERQGFSMLP